MLPSISQPMWLPAAAPDATALTSLEYLRTSEGALGACVYIPKLLWALGLLSRLWEKLLLLWGVQHARQMLYPVSKTEWWQIFFFFSTVTFIQLDLRWLTLWVQAEQSYSQSVCFPQERKGCCFWILAKCGIWKSTKGRGFLPRSFQPSVAKISAVLPIYKCKNGKL